MEPIPTTFEPFTIISTLPESSLIFEFSSANAPPMANAWSEFASIRSVPVPSKLISP